MTIEFGKFTDEMIKQRTCPKHGIPLRLTSQFPPTAKSIWTCPECSADVLDEMKKQPGVISINVGERK